MKKLITLTAALLMTTQVFALNDPFNVELNRNEEKCLTFQGKVSDQTSIDVTSQGSSLNGVDITVKSLGKGKDGKWTPFGDQDWLIKLSYKGPETNIPVVVAVKGVDRTSKGEGPDFNFNPQKCNNF